MKIEKKTSVLMDERVTIAQAVLSRMVEHYAPNVFAVLAEFESTFQSGPKFQESDFKHRSLDSLFLRFPRKIGDYKQTLTELAELAIVHPGAILNYLAKVIKQIVAGDMQKTPFTILQGFSTSYDPDDVYHNLLFKHFALLFLTDLCAQILVRFGPGDAAPALAKAGVRVLSGEHELPSVFGKLLHQWAVNFSIISETEFAAISKVFQFFVSPNDLSVFSTLVMYLRLDVDEMVGTFFVSDFLTHVKQILRRKPMPETVFIGLAHMVLTLPQDEETLQKIQQVAFQYRYDKILMMPALVLLTTVTMKASKSWDKMVHLFHKRLEPVIANKQKVELALMAFRFWMLGDDVPPELLFWEWGPNPRGHRIDLVKCNGAPLVPQTDPQSFSNLFMTCFFEKADFGVCMMKFRDVIVHLAALDFEYFLQTIVPQFLALPKDDPRFVTFLMVVPKINNPRFVKNAFADVNQEMIHKFNSVLRSRLIETLGTYHETNGPCGISTKVSDSFISTMLTEADANIAVILNEWEVKDIVLLNVTLRACEQSPDDSTLAIRLVPAARCVLNEDDLTSLEIIQLFIELSWHHENVIAANAYSFCSSIFKNASEEGKAKYVVVLLDLLETDLEPEPINVILSLLNEILTERVLLPKKLLYDIEAAAFMNLASMYPCTRHLAHKILIAVNERLEKTGIESYIREEQNQIEKIVKAQVFCYVIPTKPEVVPLPPERIGIETGLLTHYYDLWIFFLSAIMDVVIAVDYRPILDRIIARKQVLTDRIKDESGCRTPSDIGTMAIVIGSQYCSKYFYYSQNTYGREKPRGSDTTDNRKWVIEVLSSLMTSENDRLVEMAYSVARHVHYTLISSVLTIAANVDESQLQIATSTLSMILRSPGLTTSFFKHNFTSIIDFLTYLQFSFMRKELNGPRIIQWNPETEFHLVRESVWLRDYCMIVAVTFNHLPDTISEEQWRLSARVNVFRFMVNWAMTQQVSLESLRLYASMALVALCKTGTFFKDSVLFDAQTITYFGKLDLEGGRVVSNILKFHFEILLGLYIDACYTQPRAIADRYFDAIIENLSEDHCEIIAQLSGNLLVLGVVYCQREHPQAKTLVDKFVDIMERKGMVSEGGRIKYNQVKDESVSTVRMILPDLFMYATESVFWTVFRLLQSRDLHVPIKDLIEATRPWTRVLRLLPKQTVCAQGVTTIFNCFTPYRFLTELMKTTEAVDDDQFRTIASLWVELLKSPDHKSIIPLFVGEWTNSTTKQMMFEVLLAADTVNMSKRLSNMCSFAYYYHRTVCLHETCELNLWFTPLLAQVYHKNWDLLIEQIPYVINFACLFRDSGGLELFDVICHHFSVECPEGLLSVSALREVTDQMLDRLRAIDTSYVEIWGNEALKWVLGCSSLEFAMKSFVIYNRIRTPIDQTVINGLLRTVTYHLDNNADQRSFLTELVSEEFIFMTRVIKGNETLVWNLVCSFLDCKVFVDSSLMHSQKIFMELIDRIEFRRQAFSNTISIIRPLICHLETTKDAQDIVDVLISRIQSPELMMIVVPIKMNNPQLFPSCEDPQIVLGSVNDSVMCKSLVHYSMMTKSASIGVLNSIFYVSNLIVAKIVNENNRFSLAKIYQAAVRSISKCPMAIKFIQTICRREPKVATIDVIDVYEWDRSLEDVARNVRRLIVPDDSPIITITDCHSYTVVTRFLFSDPHPKILPFVAESEMLEGMKRVAQEHKPIGMKAQAAKRVLVKVAAVTNGMTPMQSEIFDEGVMKGVMNDLLTPMIHPQELIADEELKKWEESRKSPISLTDFLDAAKRSVSLCW